MRKNNNTIEINGKRYDATTGAAVKPVGSKKTGLVLDAVTRSSAITQPGATLLKPSAKPAHRDPAKAVRHHPTQPAHTLMRSAVGKPLPGAKHRLKAQGPTDLLVKQPHLEGPKLSALTIDAQRLRHARAVAKSRLVSRFNFDASPATYDYTQAQPASQPAPTAVSRTFPKPDMFERALQKASAHREPQLKRKAAKHPAKRLLRTGGAALIVLALFGVVIYQNIPNFRLRLAASKAGFAASLPAYRPAGFSIGNFSSSAGQVAMNFHSNSSDSRAFTITEKASDWDSSTLRDLYVSPKGSEYQTVEAAGRTVYLFGPNDATWVNNGVWYVVSGNGSLSNQQLIDLASSL